jgi:hypothetical protein
VCWPAAALAGRERPGDGLAGQGCAVGSDCRSGGCEDGRCVDLCCTDASCVAPDQKCRVRLTDLSEHDTWVCGSPPTESVSELCKSHNDCSTGLCVAVGDKLDLCAQPCCSSRECSTVVVGGAHYHLACTAVRDGTVRACAKEVGDAATAGLGAPCKKDEGCRSGLCVSEGADKYCSDLCCEDASCGDQGLFACLPMPFGGGWALRCVRK